ncbi:adenylyltransferase/cytidyltransferase family protein [Phormidium yuhuli AB48]|uniref:Adenylyltransferase/cytidyltransferase family protein n=1 Tax=Phormidium yuhuli AB48 TaxID=2940671 RepID=A0ABY5ARU7_9CYAN|nr:adenylyltransferase/cytidyltransferase family protein [Phormidium yuhuli]USR90873.1 adenylyltransferase/cytidyltransferase family protein [Phormidium yuhuli AB48]
MLTQGLYSLDELREQVQREGDRWRPLVFTNGCFDLLHCGHVRYLQAAKTLGNALVVGVNSDHSVAQIKPASAGEPPRPILPDRQRAEVLAALKPVDGVFIFPESTAIEAIKVLQPDIYVKGGDYRPDTLPEAPTVHAYGGEIHLIEIEVPQSTSHIIRRILGK